MKKKNSFYLLIRMSYEEWYQLVYLLHVADILDNTGLKSLTKIFLHDDVAA